MNASRFSAILLSLAMAAPVIAPVTARAGEFDVKPIRIFLSKDATSGILTVQNEANAPLRLQIAGVTWKDGDDGQPRLGDTDDLIVFPALVTIMPLEQRNIRIGFRGSAQGNEQAYRIRIDELPSLESQLDRAKGSGLQVRTRITVPVFFAPPVERRDAQIAELALRRGSIHAVFGNTGNVHAIVDNARIVARDSAGAKVVDESLKGWYVLAGETRDFQLRTPRGQCAKIKTLSVTVRSDIGTYSRSQAVSPGSCR